MVATAPLLPRAVNAAEQRLPESASLVASGLAFPEGLFTFADGALGCVEIAAGTLLRINGKERRILARPGPGPNGAARLDGNHVVVCDNGGLTFSRASGIYRITGIPGEDVTGKIVMADITTGSCRTLYANSENAPLNGPNDVAIDDDGGIWFTDTGKIRKRGRDKGALYWAASDGSAIVRVLHDLDSPNGIVIHPGGKYVSIALSGPRRILSARIEGPGSLSSIEVSPAFPGDFLFDNIVAEEDGGLVAGCVKRGGVLAIAPDSSVRGFVPLPDFAVTAVCFGGPDMSTLYAALSTTGRIVAIRWPRRGIDRAAVSFPAIRAASPSGRYPSR